MGMSEFYGATDEAQSLATLEAALAAGVTLFDTADAYGFGHNEQLLGRFLSKHRGQALVATKCGLAREAGSYARRVDNSPAYIRRACVASLARLGVEAIDLFYLHRLNLDTPLEDSMGALAQLRQEGKIRAVGLCEVSAATLRRAAAICPVAAVQSEYSLWTREPEQGVLAACRDVGASFFAYSPLGRGFLTGAIVDAASLDAGDFRQLIPALPPTTWRATRPSSRRSGTSRTQKAARRPSWRWPGCWRRATTSSPFPAPSAPPICTTTSARWPCSWTGPNWRR